jgi:hypothetical protein
MTVGAVLDIEYARLIGVEACGRNQESVVQVAMLLLLPTIDQGTSGKEYLGQF